MKRTQKPKIRILHLANSLEVGGAEVCLLNYIQALGNEDYDHYVNFFGVDGPIRHRIEALGVPVRRGKSRASIKQPFSFLCSLLSLFTDLLNFVKKNRIQVIVSQTGVCNQVAILIAKLSMRPAFPTVHTTMAFLDNRSRGDLRVHLNYAVNWMTYHAADRVIAVSDEIKNIIHQTYNLDDARIATMKNGILFHDSSIEATNLESEFPFCRDKFKIIAVGRLVSLKGFDVLVKAIAEAITRGLDGILVLIAGEGEDRKKIQDLIGELRLGNYIKLLGLRHDVISLMKACNLFVMPSFYEGLSIAMIEAMACGLPIIASSAPGLREHIQNNRNGILFPVGDSNTLADCIVKLADDLELRKKLSEGARQSFEKEYDMRTNIKVLDSLLRRYAVYHKSYE